MAKYSSQPDQGTVRVRIIEMEVDGSSQTLAETMRSVALALSRGSNGNGVRKPAALKNGTRTTETEAEPVDLADDEEAQETIEQEAVVGTKRPRSAKLPRSPKILDLDFNAATMPIGDFMAQLNAESDAKRYTAITAWYKEHMDTPVVTMDHIHTAYKRLGAGYKTPKDAGAPLRMLTKKPYQWVRSVERGKYEIHHVGEGAVQDMKNKA